MHVNGTIEHTAIVESVEPGWVGVVMQAQSACEACKARGVCGVDSGQERRIAVHTDDALDYTPGEEVIVSVEREMGFKAVAVSYIYPFLLMLAALLVLLHVGLGELAAGLLALGALAVYFFVVWLFRSKISREIVFKIRKLE